MKMTKLLAMGSAAAVAVASLASVASAAEKSFDMGYTTGTYSGSAQFTNRVNDTIGSSADQKDMKAVYFSVEGKAKAYIDKDNAEHMALCITDVNGGETWTYTTNGGGNADTWVVDLTNDLVGEWDIGNEWWENGNLTVTGFKYDKDGKKASVKDKLTLECKWANNLPGNQYFRLVVLKDTEPSYKKTEFAPYYYDEIESVDVTFNYKATDITNEKIFTVMNALNGKIKANVSNAYVTDYTRADDDSNPVEYGTNNAVNKATLAAETDNKASALLAYLFTNGGWSPSYFAYTEADLAADATTGVTYDILKYTEKTVDSKLDRQEVLLLSQTGAHNSAANAGRVDGNQSYNNGDMTQGTAPIKEIKPVSGGKPCVGSGQI